jgi:nucleotide-binding universal stress UspA family protein
MEQVVHPPGSRSAPAGTAGELRFGHLLVAVDGSDNAYVALAAAVASAQSHNARLSLICVAAPPRRTGAIARFAGIDSALELRVEARTRRILRTCLDRIPTDITVRTLVRRGRPGPEILAAARQDDYDAILLGARGIGSIRCLMGSVCHYVVQHAGTAVIVTHRPRESGPAIAQTG